MANCSQKASEVGGEDASTSTSTSSMTNSTIVYEGAGGQSEISKGANLLRFGPIACVAVTVWLFNVLL